MYKIVKIAVFTLCVVLSFNCRRPTVKTGLEGKPMPHFSMLLMDSISSISTAAIPMGEPVVFFYFSPYCPYCKAQMAKMIANIEELKNIKVYMISDFPISKIKSFYKEFELGSYPNIITGYDPVQFFASYFRPPGFPYTAIYGKDKKLKGVYLGPAVVHDIASIANE